MPDQFDVQRKLDHQNEVLADEAMEKLEDARDEGQARLARLLRLDESHYYDPKYKRVLLKDGSAFKDLGHDAARLEQAAEMVEDEARRKGYTPIADGLFWDRGMKQLYVKQGRSYVLYAKDRRSGERP